MTLPVVFTANGPSGYNLTNSLRFRKSANGYLSRTMNATSTTYTVSVWVKRGLLSGYQYIFASGPNSASNDKGIAFDTSTNQLYAFNGSTQALSTAVFRDPAAWYHVVMSVNSGTASVYVNNVNTGISQSSMSLGTYGRIGRFNDSSSANDFDGYMAEFNLIDGQALTPSSFGETSATTGVWIPKKYTGTYGTNGFYLPFTDNSALTTSSNVGLGKDFSGNANYWTTNNISITAGSTYDSMTDVPTLTSATAANYAVMNPLAKDSDVTISNGNLNFDCTSAGLGGVIGTIAVSSGKWYWEVVTTGGILGVAVGIAKLPLTAYDANQTGTYLYLNGGNKRLSPSTDSAYGASYTTNDVIGVALDMDAGTVTFYKNNTSQGTAFSSLSGDFTAWVQDGSNGDATVLNINFGQRPFSYTPPTGFVRLNTFNLTTPTIGATAATTANKYFDATTFDGVTGGGTVTNSGSMQPDFVWMKVRNNANNHELADSVRGTPYASFSNLTNAEVSDTRVSAFNSNGFSYGTNSNSAITGRTVVGWQWRASNATAVTNTAGSITSTVSANTSAGFSVVTYSANGSTGTVGHGLGVAPSMIIVKKRNAAERWCVFHTSTSNAYIYLNETFAAETTNANVRFGNNTVVVQPTNTLFTIGSSNDVNGTSGTYVAYCFAQIAGYSAFGSYTGNGSTDGPFIFTGFRPRFVMTKKSSGTGGWGMVDTSINPYNQATTYLQANTSNATVGGTSANGLDFVSNGFKIRSTDASFNETNGDTYIYMAFAESPFRYANAR